jgi:hypothetical protein
MDPAQLVSVARQVAPELPPATAPIQPAPPPAKPDKPGIHTVRMMESSMVSIAQEAKRRGLTQRQLLALALDAFGVPMAAEDLREREVKKRRA